MIIFGQKLRFCRACGNSDHQDVLAPLADLTFVLLDIDAPTGICKPCAEAYDYAPELFMFAGREDQMVA